MWSKGLTAIQPDWVNSAPTLPYQCTAKVRYRQADQNCSIDLDEKHNLVVTFESPQRAVTPGQSIVFYSGERCLGGAIIEATENIGESISIKGQE